MSSLKYGAIRAAFEILWASQLPRLVRSLSRYRGVIFTLHRVVPEPPADFSPNAILQITPQFLEFVIQRLAKLGIEIVDMDEAVRRISLPEGADRFAVLTFDDAYKDNIVHALPILEQYACPFTLYAPTAFVDGVGELWWQALEDIIAQQEVIAVPGQFDEITYLDTKSLREMQNAYDLLYWRLRGMSEPKRVAAMQELSQQYGVDMSVQCKELIMDWRELTQIAKNPLCTIGGHTVHHFELAKLPIAEARHEIEEGLRIIEAQLGVRPKHFSYPLGGPSSAGPREYELATELGLSSAVTTIPGGLYFRHKDSLMSLPRISLNGNFQSNRYVDIFATGPIFSVAAGLLS